MDCENTPVAVIDIDPGMDDGGTRGLCAEHEDAAVAYLRGLGHVVEESSLPPEDVGGCAWEASWAEDPEAVRRSGADGFASDNAELTERALGGDREALVDLLLAYDKLLQPRPLR